MKVIYTDEALRDLDEILAFIELNYPTILAAFEKRLRSVEQRIGRRPKSAEEVEQRPGVRVVPFIRYPYKLFYQIANGVIEVLYIHHAARREPWENERSPQEPT
jgi:plasmid stabilization system protein ParE